MILGCFGGPGRADTDRRATGSRDKIPACCGKLKGGRRELVGPGPLGETTDTEPSHRRKGSEKNKATFFCPKPEQWAGMNEGHRKKETRHKWPRHERPRHVPTQQEYRKRDTGRIPKGERAGKGAGPRSELGQCARIKALDSLGKESGVLRGLAALEHAPASGEPAVTRHTKHRGKPLVSAPVSRG